jgi:hypothetical protein
MVIPTYIPYEPSSRVDSENYKYESYHRLQPHNANDELTIATQVRHDIDADCVIKPSDVSTVRKNGRGIELTQCL